MKTILTRMKTLAQDNMASGQTLSYVKNVEIIHPELIFTNISRSIFPMICLTPGFSSEDWESSQRKVFTHQVFAYLLMQYNQRELSIIGDSTRPQGKGILDFDNDFLSIFRDHRLAVAGELYLDKPIEPISIDHIVEGIGDAFMLITKIEMKCTRLFLQATLPGDI